MGDQIKSTSQAEFKRFESMLNKLYKAKAEDRRVGKGTLTPEVMRKHLASGAPLDILYGVNKYNGNKPFTRDDLISFGKETKKAKSRFGFNERGVTSKQLIKASRAIDIDRARSEIRAATLYRLFNSKDGMVLHFRVTAGPDSIDRYHQVKIRLDEWTDYVTSTKVFSKSTKNILAGRISFECDCGRHQFWYRYVATIGGFAIKPLEYAYPKIKNPKLTGCCCKHVLKVLWALQGQVVAKVVQKEVEKHAQAVGFGDDKAVAGRFLKGDETDKLEADSLQANGVDKSIASKAFGLFRAAKEGIKKKMADASVVKALKQLKGERSIFKEIASREKSLRQKTEKENAQVSADLLKARLHAALLQAEYKDKITRKEAIKKFAKDTQTPIEDVSSLAKDIKI